MPPRLFRKPAKWLFAPSRRKKLSKKVNANIRNLRQDPSLILNKEEAALHAIEYYRNALAVQKSEALPNLELMQTMQSGIENAEQKLAQIRLQKIRTEENVETRRILLKKLKNKQRLPRFRK